YQTLDAGLGALILFGVVQITMFGLSALAGAGGTRRQVTGAAIAFAGLVYILWPGADAQADTAGAALMILAGIGWAGYTLAGRREPDALAATGANFVLALPVTALAIWLVGSGWQMTPMGYLWAILSGAVTSGLGYALWYKVLPGLSAPVAATVQLSVPVIAIAAGVLLLGESAGWPLVLGTLLVVGGIALAVTRRP
ncbi:MAG: DMT family transporter, partial [Pseudomonadota bacterium]